MISIVCVYSNKELLNNYLLKSLIKQTVEFELIKIDNISGSFKSASEALNYGGNKANGKYIMFVHQDVELTSNAWLEDAEEILQSIPNLGIAGVAGMDSKGNNNKDRGRNIIWHGKPAVKWSWCNPIHKPESVQTLDECLIIIPKSIFNVLRFDDKVCDDWHLYGVDYCLSAKKMGFEVNAIPMNIYHLSTSATTNKTLWQVIFTLGVLPNGYYKTLKKLLNKHKGYQKQIYTTSGNWNTSYPLIFQRLWLLMKAGLIYPFRKLQRKVN
jgi:hypothetical protein